MEWLDAFQRRHRATAFLYAVQKKYSEDRGGYLAALVTYYGFLSLFPLLLAAFTVAAYLLSGHPATIRSLERHLGTYPIIGPAVKDLQGRSLRGSPVAVIVGVVGLLWGTTGLGQVLQHAMDNAWNVPERDRAGTARQLGRGFAWYTVFGIGVVASTFVASLGSLLHWAGGPVLSALLALILNVVLFAVSFRILSPAGPGVRDVLPGAVFGGVVWTVLTGVGIGLTHKLAHANPLYGSFAPVLGLLAFLYLTARLTLYAVEANVVWARQLWPRALGKKHLVPADVIQLENLARREERIEGERVEVRVGADGPAAGRSDPGRRSP